MFEHGDGIVPPKTHAGLMQSARGIVVAENPSPPLPQFRSHATHTISQTLRNLHVESCVDSLTLRCEFVVHNSMALHCTNFLDRLRISFRVGQGHSFTLFPPGNPSVHRICPRPNWHLLTSVVFNFIVIYKSNTAVKHDTPIFVPQCYMFQVNQPSSAIFLLG